MNLKRNKLLRTVYKYYQNYKDKHSYTVGKGNKLIINGIKINCRIQIRGKNNQLIVEKSAVLRNTLVKISGNNNIVRVGNESYVSGAELWVEDNGCRLEIGKNAFVGHHSHLACTEDGSQLIVGDDGLISSYIQIRTGDSHSILDGEGNRINKAQSVRIGNHVWIGEGAKILKGVELEGDDIVSTGAIVTKSFGKNLLIGGIPAKILKENVTWDSKRI